MIITSTGWTFEYVDELSLNLALELLQYARRESGAQKGQGQEASTSRPPWIPPTEQEAESQFLLTQSMVPPGMIERANKIPEHYREAIRWAESEKKKKGLI